MQMGHIPSSGVVFRGYLHLMGRRWEIRRRRSSQNWMRLVGRRGTWGRNHASRLLRRGSSRPGGRRGWTRTVAASLGRSRRALHRARPPTPPPPPPLRRRAHRPPQSSSPRGGAAFCSSTLWTSSNFCTHKKKRGEKERPPLVCSLALFPQPCGCGAWGGWGGGDWTFQERKDVWSVCGGDGTFGRRSQECPWTALREKCRSTGGCSHWGSDPLPFPSSSSPTWQGIFAQRTQHPGSVGIYAHWIVAPCANKAKNWISRRPRISTNCKRNNWEKEML